MTVRLFCLAHAGGSSAIFQTWRLALGPDIDVCPVELPGHGSRRSESACESVDAAVEAVTATIRPRLDAPVALFGHSMGGLVAFELARHLEAHTRVTPLALYVAGRRAAHIPLPHAPWYALPQADFFRQWRRIGGAPAALFDDSRMRAITEPILRADARLVQTYRYLTQRPLSCPLIAFGATDDPHCRPQEIEEWRTHTAGSFRMHMLQGGHFFIESQRQRFLTLLSADLRERLATLDGAAR